MPPSAPSWKPDRRNPQHRRPDLDRPMRGQRLRRFQYRPECQPGNVRGGTEQRLQHQHPGHRVSDPHAWQQREYRPTGVGVFNAAAASVYRLAPDSVRPVKTAAIVGNGQLTPGEYGRAQVSGNPFDQYFRVVVAGGSILTPPAASMPARKTSPCRSARSIARPFRARVPRRRPALSFRLNCNSLPAGQGNTVMITMDATADPSGQPEHCAWPQPDRVRSRAAWAYRYAMRSTTRSCSAVDGAIAAGGRRVLHRALHPDHRHGDGGPGQWPATVTLTYK